MSFIETNAVQHATILRIYSEKDEIVVDPEYQRNGGIWTQEKKQLLIDSILNNYDIPKIYFHQYDRIEKRDSGKSYAIIDGKQRLEAIWSFIDGKFCLSDGFEYQDDRTVDLSGLSYNDLAKEFPKIKIKFDSFVLPIVGVQTDDVDLIEDMFSRLNEAAPLNSAEKRNAFGGEMVKAIRSLASHTMFTTNVKFKNNRYQHFEICARFLLVEISMIENDKLFDTKKIYLDNMVKRYKTDKVQVDAVSNTVTTILNTMTNCFVEKDDLLRTQGIMVVYYLLFKSAAKNGVQITRAQLLKFDAEVRLNKEFAEENYEKANHDLIEFDNLSQYGTNDVANIKERLRIIENYLFPNKPHFIRND